MWNKANCSLYPRRSKSKLNLILNVLIVIITLALIFELIFVSKYTGVYVVDVSMTPTLTGAPDEDSAGGDYVYVDKNASPSYGDIVVVSRVNDSPLIKRVIALGGDSVKLVGGKLYLKYAGEEDFVLVEESYLDPQLNSPSKNINNFPQSGGKVDEKGHYVEKGRMFLLGDNRDYSSDSRQNGDFENSHLLGVVTKWSMRNKKFISSVHKYFNFDLPRYFGIKR